MDYISHTQSIEHRYNEAEKRLHSCDQSKLVRDSHPVESPQHFSCPDCTTTSLVEIPHCTEYRRHLVQRTFVAQYLYHQGPCCASSHCPSECWGGAARRGSGWKVMGRGLAPSLSKGPLPPLFFLVSHKLATVLSSGSPAVIFVTVALFLMLGAPPATDAQSLPFGRRSSDPERQECNIQPCWNQYLDIQDYFEIHIDYDQLNQPHLDPEKLLGFCQAQRTFYQCLKAMQKNKTMDCHSDIGFRSALNGIERSMEERNCSRNGTVINISDLQSGKDRPLVCTYNGPRMMRFCSLFGDPHLRTFQDEFQTCQIQGAWPLLDNRYLTVQVTSKAVGASSGPATAITELTVMIKAHDDCAAERFVTYQAQAGFLPPMFDDNTLHFGPERSVVLREIKPNHHVEIYLRYIDTTVVVRHYPSLLTPFLTVSLRMPEKILNQSATYLPNEETTIRTLELCSSGCPSNQEIDYNAYLSKAVTVTKSGHGRKDNRHLFPEEKNSIEGMQVLMSRNKALEQCLRLKLVDFYLDSCVFDLMNTNNSNFSQASADAQSDTILLHPDGASTLENRTYLQVPDHIANSAHTVNNLYYLHRTTFVLMVAMATCAFNALCYTCSSLSNKMVTCGAL